MGSLVRYACCGKEMLGQIREKMAIPESTPGGGRYFAFDSTTIGNGTSACNDLCAPVRDCLIVTGNGA